jgi:hypothetical protein
MIRKWCELTRMKRRHPVSPKGSGVLVLYDGSHNECARKDSLIFHLFVPVSQLLNVALGINGAEGAFLA